MVLTSMMSFIELRAILDKIVSVFGTDQFGEFKSIIQDMVDSYAYEESILETVNQLLRRDMHNTFAELRCRRTKAYRANFSSCPVCTHSLSDPKFLLDGDVEGLSIFRCGHAYHLICLAKFRVCPVCNKSSRIDSKKSDEDKSDEQLQLGNVDAYEERLQSSKFLAIKEGSKLDVLYKLQGKERKTKAPTRPPRRTVLSPRWRYRAPTIRPGGTSSPPLAGSAIVQRERSSPVALRRHSPAHPPPLAESSASTRHRSGASPLSFTSTRLG
eukprot:TRINITY_DN6013_c0_g1_i2.p1 TRINITY_DN6013_c0_g1~~TRINITY_DN6013_c0_g1_i2.p1  ORF type:complete len:270 (-),score=42.40 TRINITY_DN6013_c0_g1_i2:13-822(-)